MTTQYGYDAQGNLRTVATPDRTTTYSYDAARNRTQLTTTAKPPATYASRYFGSNPASGGWSTQDVNPRFMADVNGDGRDDLIGVGNAEIYVALGQTDGQFGYPITASVSMTPANTWTNNTIYPRMAAKVNSDQYADLIGFASNGIYVALGQANGTFSAPYLAASGFGANGGWTSQESYPRFVADVNGDGLADVIGIASNAVWVRLGQPAGTFATEISAGSQFTLSSGWQSQNLYPRTVVDVNGDGKADLVGFASDGVYVAKGQANGTFAASVKAIAGFGQTTGGWGDFDTNPRFVRDVTGDGRADVVGFGSGYVYISAGQLDGTFAQWQTYETRFVVGQGWGQQSAQPRLVGDVNGDGKADLIGIAPEGVYRQQLPY